MKEILIQLAKVFMVAMSCVFQLVALVFAGIAWVFDKSGTLLGCVSIKIMDLVEKVHKNEENSEVVPT